MVYIPPSKEQQKADKMMEEMRKKYDPRGYRRSQNITVIIMTIVVIIALIAIIGVIFYGATGNPIPTTTVGPHG